jgi:hypothetical protein
VVDQNFVSLLLRGRPKPCQHTQCIAVEIAELVSLVRLACRSWRSYRSAGRWASFAALDNAIDSIAVFGFVRLQIKARLVAHDARKETSDRAILAFSSNLFGFRLPSLFVRWPRVAVEIGLRELNALRAPVSAFSLDGPFPLAKRSPHRHQSL